MFSSVNNPSSPTPKLKSAQYFDLFQSACYSTNLSQTCKHNYWQMDIIVHHEIEKHTCGIIAMSNVAMRKAGTIRMTVVKQVDVFIVVTTQNFWKIS